MKYKCKKCFDTKIDYMGNTCAYCKKPKPKLARIKAWGRFIFCGTKSLETLQAQTIKQFQCQDKKVFNFDIPCTILIDKKYLKEK